MCKMFLSSIALAFLLLVSAQTFDVYYNVPSWRCLNYSIDIAPERFGFKVNRGQKLIGDQIALFYDPGEFPQVKNGRIINGGIPQRGDLQAHIRSLTAIISCKIPQEQFAGPAVIDFEAYQPFFNTVLRPVYREMSLNYTRQLHPDKDELWIKNKTKHDFETAARKFMEATLRTAQRLRPMAKWGFYQYPLCYNLHVKGGHCSKQANQENKRLAWLYSASAAVYPSFYVFKQNFSNSDRLDFVRGHLDEVKSLNLSSRAYAYTWYRYHEVNTYVSTTDMLLQLALPALYGLPGVIVWGSNADVSDPEHCRRLLNYTNSVMGPIVKLVTSLNISSTHTLTV